MTLKLVRLIVLGAFSVVAFAPLTSAVVNKPVAPVCYYCVCGDGGCVCARVTCV
jgi:hypothetical protein